MYFYFHTSCTTRTQVVLVHSHVFLLPHLMHYLDTSGTNPLACISTSNFGHYSDPSGTSPLTCISTSTPRALLGPKWYYSTHMYFYFHTSCTTWTQVVLIHSHVFLLLTSGTTRTQVVLVHSHVFLLPHLVHYLDTSGTSPLTCISTSTPRALLGHKWC